MNDFYDLVLDTGELIRMEIPHKFEDDFLTAIEDAMKRKDWFSTSQFDGCEATFLGLQLTRINMGRVVATL